MAKADSVRTILYALGANLAIAAGKTVDDVLKANLTAAYARDWPGGHERFVRTLYQELSGR